MKQKEKQAFLFRYKWLNRMSRLTPTQIVLLLKTMNEYSQDLDIKEYTKKMNEKTLIVWELIQEDMQEDIQAYEDKCNRLRQNARLGGLAKSRNILANASKCYQMEANDTKSTQIVPDSDSDSDIKEKIYKKENSNCYNLDELLQSSFADTEVANKFNDFLNMRAKLPNNKGVSTVATFNALVEKLRTLAKNKQEALKVLENSIINNLTDLYPLKNKSSDEGGIKYAN